MNKENGWYDADIKDYPGLDIEVIIMWSLSMQTMTFVI